MVKPKTWKSRRRSGASRSGFDRGISVVAQLSWLLTLAGFLASAGINTLVFRQWGLSFLQIASPSDVLMSGTTLMVPLLGLIFVTGVMAATWAAPTLKWLSAVHEKVRRNQGMAEPDTPRPDPDDIISPDIVPKAAWANWRYWLMTSMVVVLLSVMIIVQDERWLVPFVEKWMLYVLLALGITMTAVGAFSVYSEYRKGKLIAILSIVSAFLGFSLVWLGLTSYFDLAARDGFAGRPYSVHPAPAACGTANRLLWTGSQASVVACLDKDGCVVGTLVLRDHEGVSFRSTAPQAQEQPWRALFNASTRTLKPPFRKRCAR